MSPAVSTGDVGSRDGTRIAWIRVGQGPPVVLVDGALGSRARGPNGALAGRLAAAGRAAWRYDRRGRGGSGDNSPYSPEREVEDLAAVVAAAGGDEPVGLFGFSSGAMVALEAVSTGLPVARLALYEAPFVVDGSRPPLPEDHEQRLADLLRADRRSDAVRMFLGEGAGLSRGEIRRRWLSPEWRVMTGLAHTLPYDAAFAARWQRGAPLPAGAWDSVTIPVLVLAGGRGWPWIRTAARALAADVPGAEHRELAGQTHQVRADVLAPVLDDFFGG